MEEKKENCNKQKKNSSIVEKESSFQYTFLYIFNSKCEKRKKRNGIKFFSLYFIGDREEKFYWLFPLLSLFSSLFIELIFWCRCCCCCYCRSCELLRKRLKVIVIVPNVHYCVDFERFIWKHSKWNEIFFLLFFPASTYQLALKKIRMSIGISCDKLC